MRHAIQRTTHPNDRRLNWHERRMHGERRNAYRVRHMGPDCRSGVPRRQADITGESREVDVWWELEYPGS